MEQNLPTRKAGIPQGIVIILINMLPMMAIVALMPVVPAIRDNFKDMPNILTWAPLVLSAPGLCIALLSPYAGFLTDKLGRRKLLLIFVTLYGFGGVLPFFMESFPALMSGRLILGIGEAFLLTIANTLLGDYFSHKERTNWLMVQGFIASACGSVLLSTSGYLANVGWQYPFLVYGLAFIITIAAYFFIFEPEKSAISHEPSAMSNVQTASSSKLPLNLIIQICGTTLIASIIYFVYTLQFSLALDGLGLKRQQIGNYSALASLAVPLGALLFKLISNKPMRAQLLIVAACVGIGLTGIGVSKSLEMVVASAWIQQLGCGMVMPVLIAWGLNSLPSEFRGRGMGLWSSAFFLGQFVSPFFFTAMRSVTGSSLNAFVAFGILCLVLGGLNFIFGKKELEILRG
jgi:MFS family permease